MRISKAKRAARRASHVPRLRPAWRRQPVASGAGVEAPNLPSPEASRLCHRTAHTDTVVRYLSAGPDRARSRVPHRSDTRAVRCKGRRSTTSGSRLRNARCVPPCCRQTRVSPDIYNHDPSEMRASIGDLLCYEPPELSTMLPRGRSSAGVRPAPSTAAGATGAVARGIGGACGNALDLRQRDRTRPAQSGAEHDRAVGSRTRLVPFRFVGGCRRVGTTQTSSGNPLLSWFYGQNASSNVRPYSETAD